MEKEISTEIWNPRLPDIADHWVLADFDDVFDNVSTNGIKIPQNNYLSEGAFPVVDQGQNLIGGYTNDESKVIHGLGDVIIFGDHTRCFKLIEFDFAPGADGVKVLKPSKCIDPKFIYYAIRAVKLPNRGYSRHYAFLKKSKLPLSCLNEQKRIVAKIEELFSELDEGVESLKTAREQLRVYRQAVLKHAFEGKLTAKWREQNKDTLESANQLLDQLPSYRRKNLSAISTNEISKLPSLPNDWAYARLGYFIENINAGKSFKCEERQPEINEFGIAKVSAVTWGEYDESESKTCVDLEKINPNYFIRQGDFLFSRANTIELVGACVIAKHVTRNIMLSDKTLRIQYKDISPYYFLYYLRSQMGRNEIMERSTGNQESMRNIGQDRIRNIVIPICSSREAHYMQQEIQNRFSAIEQMENTIATELQKSEALRQSILKKAFSGKLVPQDPNDEPASVLLERIRAEKEDQSGKKSSNRNGRGQNKVALLPELVHVADDADERSSIDLESLSPSSLTATQLRFDHIG